MGKYIFVFDGDNVCYGLNCDFGFIDVDWVENICCVLNVVKLMSDVGLIMLVSFILLFWLECCMVCNMMVEGEFVEVFVDMLLDVVEVCDVKGFYKWVCVGEIKNFMGFDSLYEVLDDFEICINMVEMSVEDVVD